MTQHNETNLELTGLQLELLLLEQSSFLNLRAIAMYVHD